MNRTIPILAVIFLFVCVIACNENKPVASLPTATDSTGKVCLTPSDINPNGASELAQLMRTMETQTENWKKEIDAGAKELSPVPDVYNTLKTAIPTEAEMKNNNFNAFSDDFVNYSTALVKAPKAERKMAFNTMVGGCMACHEQMCPGPVKRIQKFYF